MGFAGFKLWARQMLATGEWRIVFVDLYNSMRVYLGVLLARNITR